MHVVVDQVPLAVGGDVVTIQDCCWPCGHRLICPPADRVVRRHRRGKFSEGIDAQPALQVLLLVVVLLAAAAAAGLPP